VKVNCYIYHELFYLRILDYHSFFTIEIPDLKQLLVLLKRISTALDTKPEDTDALIEYYKSRKFDEESKMVYTNRHIKLQEVTGHQCMLE